MRVERCRVLGAAPYERTECGLGHANGYEPKKYRIPFGALKLHVPQVCGDVAFYPSVLERGARSERALMLAGSGDVCHRRLHPAGD